MVIKHKPNKQQIYKQMPLSVCLKVYCPQLCVIVFWLIKETVKEFEHLCSLLGIFIFNLESKI